MQQERVVGSQQNLQWFETLAQASTFPIMDQGEQLVGDWDYELRLFHVSHRINVLDAKNKSAAISRASQVGCYNDS